MVHGITEYQMREMNNGNIPYRSIAVLLFTVLLSSCLKETAVPIESTFTIEASEDKTSPVTIQLKNESYGAEEYEWTFEGGIPSSNKDEVFEVIWNNETLRKNVFGQMSNPDFKVQAKLLFMSKINNKTQDIFNSILMTK